MRYAVWLFLGPALIHVWWGVCVLASPSQLKTTGLHDLYIIAGGRCLIAGLLLLVVGAMAVSSIPLHAKSPRLALFLLLPQQFTVIVSAFTAWRCIRQGTFADGLPYDSLFISADQVYIFIIGGMHTGLIVDVYLWEGALRWMKAGRRYWLQ